MIVRALVADLMDRSRISAAAPGVQFVRSADELAGADLALVDLQRVDPAAVPPGVRTIGYASHVDRATIGTAAAAGIEAMAVHGDPVNATSRWRRAASSSPTAWEITAACTRTATAAVPRPVDSSIRAAAPSRSPLTKRDHANASAVNTVRRAA